MAGRLLLLNPLEFRRLQVSRYGMVGLRGGRWGMVAPFAPPPVVQPLPEFYGWGSVTRGHLDAPGGFDEYEVTSLSDTNTPGTLRNAISTIAQPNTLGRLIKFGVGGDMTLTGHLEIVGKNYITIDGLTAPDPGFRIVAPPNAAGTFSALTLESNSTLQCHDIIVRGMHFYGNGEGIHVDGDILGISGGFPAGGGLGVHRCVFDRNCCVAACDGIFDIFKNGHDISYTRNLIAKTLDVTNFNTGSAAAGQPPGVERMRITWAHNVWTRCNGRQPRITWKSWDLDDVNNIIYGWGWYEGGAAGLRLVPDNGLDSARLNFEDNVLIFVANPSVPSVVPDNAISIDTVAGPFSNIQMYMAGNVLPVGESTTVGNAPRIAIPEYAQVPRIPASAVLDFVGARQKTLEEQLIIDEVRAAL